MPPSTSPAAAGRALAEDSEQPQQCCQTTKVSNVQITPVSPDTMKKKHISRKMYFKEITPKQGSSSSAHGCAQVLLLPRKQDLLGEHLLAPKVGPYTQVCISAASAERKMQGMRHFKEEIFLSMVLSFGNLLCAPNPIVSETRRTKAATHQDSKLQGLS